MSRHATSPSEAVPARGAALEPERAVALHRTMLVIRRAEERLAQLFADGEVPGFIHLSIGQEGIAVGIGAALEPTDTIASTHRGHGHAIAKGVPLAGFFAEIMGRDTGLCRGRGGSMHVADMSVGMLGANGIVGAGIPLALGSAIAHDTRGTDSIAVAFFGDGALAEGVLHESLNMAALWGLPMLFVNENNGWSEFSPAAEQFRAKVTDLAGAFGIESQTVDGNDVAGVFAAAEEMTARLRAGEGPLVLECLTTRVRGHFEGDPQKYRPEDDIDPARDPIAISRAALVAQGVAEARLDALVTEVEAEVEEAIAAAREGAPADFEAAARDVYTGEAA